MRLSKSRSALIAAASDAKATNNRYKPQLSRFARATTASGIIPLTSSPSNPARNITTIQTSNNHNTINHCSKINNPGYAKMSTMPAQHGHSEACCNIPPIVSTGYSEKGSYEELGGYKSYVTGPADAKKGVVVIYDIFGYFPQTVQGADIMATSDATKYRVFMPDWFKGNPSPIEWFPPDTEEKQKNLGAFFQKNQPGGVAAQLPAYVKAVSDKYPDIKDWAVLGFCWGGKVVSLVTSSPENPFKAGVEVHPAMVDPKDADKIKVPLALLASKDENPEDVKQFEANLTGPKYVETYGDQIHGWMAARSDLNDERVKSEYKRGYLAVLKFLAQYL